MPKSVREPQRYDHAEAAQQSLSRIRRVIEFMDRTELLPSPRLFRLFPWSRGLPGYADHTLLWRDAEKRLLMTTEPYGMPERLMAPPPGWRALALPPGYGLWTALDPDGYAPTGFIWLTPIDGGVDLEALAGRLMVAKAQEEMRSLPTCH